MTLDTTTRRFAGHGLAGLLALALPQCSAGGGGEHTASSRQAIVGGAVVDGPGSPVLYLVGPQGTCTSVLIAPTLVATARHCAAQLVEGPPSCTPEGTLIPNGSGAGELGADDTPGSLSFFSAAKVAAGPPLGAPDAVGVQILSTQAPSICSDDLAFVVLDRAIPGLMPAPVRIDGPTEVGESVAVFGYGLTEHSADPLTLRVRDDAQVVGVGPDLPTSVPQAAPLRSLRIGPGSVTCNGDSGGPVFSTASGALIGLVSLGTQANPIGLFCSDGTAADTTGPELADYRDLALSAFGAAGATPILEAASSDAASSDTESLDAESLDAGSLDAETSDEATSDAASPDTEVDGGWGLRPGAEPSPYVDGSVASGIIEYVAAGGSCAIALRQDRSGLFRAIVCGFVWMAVAARRRRR